MIDIKYIDLKSGQKTLTVGFTEDKVYKAHEVEQDHLVAYVPKKDFDIVLSQLKSHDEKTAEAILKDLGLK